MRFRDKNTGAIYVVTTDDVLSMFKNDRYELVEEKPKTKEKIEETLEVEETEEVKEVKKNKKK